MPGGQHCLVQLRWKGGHPCLGSRLTFDPKHAQLGSCLDSELASPWPQHPVGPKRLPCHVLYGARHCLGHTQSYVQTPPSQHGNIWFLRIWMYRCRFMAPSTTNSSLLHLWWIAPHTMTDGPRFPSLGWHKSASPLASDGQKPSPNGSNWHPLRWSGSFWPFKAVECLPVALRFSSNLRASSDVVGQSLGCIAKFCLCILETHPASWLLLTENCHLPTTWQFAAVFALANFVSWSPLKVQRNINILYQNPTLHKSIKLVMARQTSLQMITPELTCFPSLESQRSPDNTDCVWPFTLAM